MTGSRCLLTRSLCACVLLSSAAHAVTNSGQESSSASPPREPPALSSPRPSRREAVLQEVIVTAQKRRQRAFDVPISLQVLGSDELRKQGITNLNDLQFSVPGMYVQDTGEQRRVELDGVSNVFGGDVLVGEYIDEADATALGDASGYATLDLRAYDLERVEVLKGPQGTLYGDGSMGGTVRYIANKPMLDRYEADLDAQANFIQYGAPGEDIVAILNTPLIEQRLGFRVAGEFDHAGGWMDQPAANRKNINEKNLVDVRVEGRWQPVSTLRIDALQIIHRNAFGPSEGEDSQGNYTQTFGFTLTPNDRENYDLSNLTLSYDLDKVRLLSSTTYFAHSMVILNSGSRFQFTPPGTPPYDDFGAYFADGYRDFSQELRLARAGRGPWQWTVGAFYKRTTDTDPAYTYYLAPEGTPPDSPYYVGSSNFASKAWAGFGDTSYKLFGRLTIGAGARYFRNSETAGGVGEATQSAIFHSIDPRLYLQYEITTDLNAYASAAKGFRSGGFNLPGQPTFQPESVWRYELGSKMRFLDGRVRADGDVFLTDYTNYVVIGYTISNPSVEFSHNGGDVRIKGVEGDVSWEPVPGWRLSATGDYIDGRFVAVNVLGADYDVGDPLDMVPKYSVAIAAEHDFHLAGKPAFARVDYSQRPPESYRLRSLGPWYYGQSEHLYLLGLRTGVRWNENLNLALFAQNLLNDRGYIDPFNNEGLGSREQPRTFGIEFDSRFD